MPPISHMRSYPGQLFTDAVATFLARARVWLPAVVQGPVLSSMDMATRAAGPAAEPDPNYRCLQDSRQRTSRTRSSRTILWLSCHCVAAALLTLS
jgi:hypothetical protein